MEFELIIDPTKKEHYPDRYRAVLLLNGGLSKMYGHDMDMETIIKSVREQVNTFADGILKLS